MSSSPFYRRWELVCDCRGRQGFSPSLRAHSLYSIPSLCYLQCVSRTRRWQGAWNLSLICIFSQIILTDLCREIFNSLNSPPLCNCLEFSFSRLHPPCISLHYWASVSFMNSQLEFHIACLSCVLLYLSQCWPPSSCVGSISLNLNFVLSSLRKCFSYKEGTTSLVLWLAEWKWL